MRPFIPSKMKKVAPPAPAKKADGPGKALLRKMANEIVDGVAVVVDKLQAAVEKAQEKLRGQVVKVGEKVDETQAVVSAVAKVAKQLDERTAEQLALVQELHERAPEPRPKAWKFQAVRKSEGRWEVTARAES